MRINANLNDVTERGPLPGGMYRGRCRTAPKLEKSSSGKDMLVFDIEIIDLDPELKDTCFTNLKYRVVKSDTDGWQTWGMKQISQAFGVPFDEEGLDTEDFADAEGDVVVERELYKGKEQAKISGFATPTE